MTITVISTIAVNVAVRSDNPKEVTNIVRKEEVVVHTDGIKSSSQYEALKVLGKSYDDKDYDLLTKSSYLYNFGNTYAPEIEKLYRRTLYNLCKTIAEVDSEITAAEEEWLNEIALLNDNDPDNDIDISGL